MARADLLDVRPGWGGGKLNAATVSLEPLTEDQARALVANLLGSADLPIELAEGIVEKAEGNPLFVEETFAMLIDDGLVVREDDRWRVTGDLSAVTVPPSIQALLAARLERLSPEERTVLEAAAVIGKDFFVGAVRELVPEDARQRVPSDLMALVRKELIRAERTTLPGEDAFRFRHLLIRDSTYDAIAKAQRAALHERFADWLERVAGNAVEQEEIVGYHLEQAYAYRTQLAPADERSAAIGRRAAGGLATAGRRASGRGDFPAAANLLRRASTVGPPGDAERAATLYHLGVALYPIGDAHAAFAAFDEAVRLAEIRAIDPWSGSLASAAPRSRRCSIRTACPRRSSARSSRKRSASSRSSKMRPAWRTRGRGSHSLSKRRAGSTGPSARRAEPRNTPAAVETTGSSRTPSPSC